VIETGIQNCALALWRSGQSALALSLLAHFIIFTCSFPSSRVGDRGVTCYELGGAVRCWAPSALNPPALIAEEL